MSYTKKTIKETISNVWEEPDGSTTYDTIKEIVEVKFENYRDYVNKVLVKVLKDFYVTDGLPFDENTAYHLLYDFDDIAATIEEEFSYDINNILLKYYYAQKEEE